MGKAHKTAGGRFLGTGVRVKIVSIGKNKPTPPRKKKDKP